MGAKGNRRSNIVTVVTKPSSLAANDGIGRQWSKEVACQRALSKALALFLGRACGSHLPAGPSVVMLYGCPVGIKHGQPDTGIPQCQ